jgi:hypothetical protein
MLVSLAEYKAREAARAAAQAEREQRAGSAPAEPQFWDEVWALIEARVAKAIAESQRDLEARVAALETRQR